MDSQYWNEYYQKGITPQEPSHFAKSILSGLEIGRTLLELGCGNGRDAVFFWKNGMQVTGIDQSNTAIAQLTAIYGGKQGIQFIQDDFVSARIYAQQTFHYGYSRFTLHSIEENLQPLLLQNVYHCLDKDGKLFIEARSVRDAIYGKGEPAGRNAYIYQGHYRRFLVKEELTADLQKAGFTIEYAEEADQWAVYEQENPIVLRVVAAK